MPHGLLITVTHHARLSETKLIDRKVMQGSSFGPAISLGFRCIGDGSEENPLRFLLQFVKINSMRGASLDSRALAPTNWPKLLNDLDIEGILPSQWLRLSGAESIESITPSGWKDLIESLSNQKLSEDEVSQLTETWHGEGVRAANWFKLLRRLCQTGLTADMWLSFITNLCRDYEVDRDKLWLSADANLTDNSGHFVTGVLDWLVNSVRPSFLGLFTATPECVLDGAQYLLKDNSSIKDHTYTLPNFIRGAVMSNGNSLVRDFGLLVNRFFSLVAEEEQTNRYRFNFRWPSVNFSCCSSKVAIAETAVFLPEELSLSAVRENIEKRAMHLKKADLKLDSIHEALVGGQQCELGCSELSTAHDSSKTSSYLSSDMSSQTECRP